MLFYGRTLQNVGIKTVNLAKYTHLSNSVHLLRSKCYSFQFETVPRTFFNSAYGKKLCAKTSINYSNFIRRVSQHQKSNNKESSNAFWYILSGMVFMIGATYAAVPLFKIFCESQGIDVNTEYRDKGVADLKQKLKSMVMDTDRRIEVKFDATTSGDLLWKFVPTQESVTVSPGETSLAFFRAKNLTDRPIIGIATYTILPYDAGLYFNKIQCFCFEEQRLEPNEEVDMPVLFFLDDQFARDPKLENVDQICLSYTFFESKGSEDLANLQKLAFAAGKKIN
jgi:cytochrome c oxidase assembly protein subunit 11